MMLCVIGQIDMLEAGNEFHNSGVGGQLVIQEHAKRWPRSWLDIRDSPVEIRNHASLAQAFGF